MTTLESVLHEVEEREKELAALSKLWAVTVGEHTPSTVQFSTWLSLHGFAGVVEGIRITGRKFSEDGRRDGRYSPSAVHKLGDELPQRQGGVMNKTLTTLIWQRCPAKFHGTKLVILP